MLVPPVEVAIRRDAPNGDWWAYLVKPLLPWVLRRVIVDLQASIEECLDLREVVLSAFMRDVSRALQLTNRFERIDAAHLSMLTPSRARAEFRSG